MIKTILEQPPIEQNTRNEFAKRFYAKLEHLINITDLNCTPIQLCTHIPVGYRDKKGQQRGASDINVLIHDILLRRVQIPCIATRLPDNLHYMFERMANSRPVVDLLFDPIPDIEHVLGILNQQIDRIELFNKLGQELDFCLNTQQKSIVQICPDIESHIQHRREAIVRRIKIREMEQAAAKRRCIADKTANGAAVPVNWQCHSGVTEGK